MVAAGRNNEYCSHLLFITSLSGYSDGLQLISYELVESYKSLLLKRVIPIFRCICGVQQLITVRTAKTNGLLITKDQN